MYVGNVGERITFTIKDFKILCTKDNTRFSYYAEATRVYSIINEDGNIIIWNTAKDLKKEDIITARVKAQKEFRGQKQTIITRGTIKNKNF